MENVVLIKKEVENVVLIKKRHQMKNTLLKWILQKVWRTAKFIMAGFYEIDLMKGIVRLGKVD